MAFRLKALGLHMLFSALVLGLVFIVLYFGWYAWPGWYLVGASKIAGILALVDIGIGPLATLVVSNPKKPSLELRRDVSVIIVVQVFALVYGATTLWNGRPLFYTFSSDRFEIVTASDIDRTEWVRAEAENPRFVEGGFARPQWVWAPLPEDEDERSKIVNSAIFSGKDVIHMPRYYRPLKEAQSSIRDHLKSADQIGVLSPDEKLRLKASMEEVGAIDKLGVILLGGPVNTAVAVIDRETLEIRRVFARER